MTRDEENLAEIWRRLRDKNPSGDNNYRIGQLFGYFWKQGQFKKKYPELHKVLVERYGMRRVPREWTM